MQCNDIRRLLLTDYIDDRVSARRKTDTDRHLILCPACKEFFTAVNKAAVEPFAGAGRVEPPGLVWQRTREAIIAEQNDPGLAAGFLSRLRSALYIPKPALAAAGAVILIIAVGTMAHLQINREKALKAHVQEQVEYFGYLTEAPSDIPVNNETGLGTSIEQYFL